MNFAQFSQWLERKKNFQGFTKPLIMGILNATPDSFYDGGIFLSIDKACEQAFKLIAQGVDIVDIGGESSKPGAVQVSVNEELQRVIPIIQQIRLHSDVCISIDTYKAQVMRAAVNAGANIINDIYALRKKDALLTAAQLGVPVCLMHMQGQPSTMQKAPYYPTGIIKALKNFFTKRITLCEQAGIRRNNLIIDPGFGFGKSVKNNLDILYYLNDLKFFDLPILLGVSRKSTIGAILNKEIDQRLIGGVSVAVFAAMNGVSIIRTHDVDETNQALTMIKAINQTG